ncbi:MAG: glycosyltransferase family 2 protein [Candidatus Omnitrophica bacterium]|nr:glycosyltransferase family 2 protein [Candidatus Omnitrophota bacterium]MCM8789130.1 glycosyltransferase family 2 protein [Candidatus Omnitrophota bacterium]
MKISILIPVYNEQDSVAKVIEKVLSLKLEKEVIVIDDGSTDCTSEILDSIISKEKKIRVISQWSNRGKGAAIVNGLSKATGDYVIIQDADLELDPSDIIKLAQAIDRNHSVIYGSRFLEKQKVSLLSFLANRFLTFLTNLLYRAKLTDMETCYKLCKREILLGLELKSKGFEIEPEITCKILKKGYRIKEIPVSYKPRRTGKKISWVDGFKAIFAILKYRIT